MLYEISIAQKCNIFLKENNSGHLDFCSLNTLNQNCISAHHSPTMGVHLLIGGGFDPRYGLSRFERQEKVSLLGGLPIKWDKRW